MATKEQQIRLKKAPKSTPCPDGKHNEIIQRPTVPPEEEDPHQRVEAMRRSGANRHEIESALHNITEGHITHGNQLSRLRTPEEKARKENGDIQKIFAICVVCRKKREIDQSPDDSSVVEAKNKKEMDPVQRDQALENATFSKQSGNSAMYKLPPGQAEGSRAKAIAVIFRGANARPPRIIGI